MTKDELRRRWVGLLRGKAEYEHNARKNGEVVCEPDIDDICNEIESFFTGLIN